MQYESDALKGFHSFGKSNLLTCLKPVYASLDYWEKISSKRLMWCVQILRGSLNEERQVTEKSPLSNRIQRVVVRISEHDERDLSERGIDILLPEVK